MRLEFRAVEQTVYRSDNVQRDWRELGPPPPIVFTVQGERGIDLEGINLKDALDLHYSHLKDRDELMFTHERIRGSSVACRIEVRAPSTMAFIIQPLLNPFTSLVQGMHHT